MIPSSRIFNDILQTWEISSSSLRNHRSEKQVIKASGHKSQTGCLFKTLIHMSVLELNTRLRRYTIVPKVWENSSTRPQTVRNHLKDKISKISTCRFSAKNSQGTICLLCVNHETLYARARISRCNVKEEITVFTVSERELLCSRLVGMPSRHGLSQICSPFTA